MDVLLKIMATTLAINQTDNNHNRLVRPQNILNRYDYIVVGAGGAGAVVAARLAEDRSKSVLLLEAGGPQNHIIDTPALVGQVLGTESLQWRYPMIGQMNAYKGYSGNNVSLAAGKVFGGSTTHNAMNYHRDSEHYSSLWQSLYGIKNWTFADVLPFFLKSENNFDEKLVKMYPKYHRSGGRLGVSTADPPDLMLRRYINIAIKYGADYTFTDGRYPMGFGGNSGVTLVQRLIANGTRQSTSTAFLERDIKPNLTTIGFAFVTKVLFDSNKRAIGVKFRCNNTGVWRTVYTNREIILSAGAIGSVKLLLLSGIGPAEHLTSMHIPVVCNVRGVGSRMSYNIGFTQNYDIINQTEIPKPIQTVDNMYDYYVHRKGPLSYIASGIHCLKAVPFRPNPNVNKGCIDPRLSFLSQDLDSLSAGRKLTDQWKDYYRPYLGHTVLSLVSLLTKVQTNGTIRLKSDNPFDNPVVNPCVYCNAQDLEDGIKLFQSSIVFFENNDIQRYIRRFEKPFPGCTPCAHNWYCYDYVKCMVQSIPSSPLLCATNIMGAHWDPDSVVDNRFNVKGVKGLRVIDYSVIPLSIPNQTSWVVAVAERGADIIKADNQ